MLIYSHFYRLPKSLLLLLCIPIRYPGYVWGCKGRACNKSLSLYLNWRILGLFDKWQKLFIRTLNIKRWLWFLFHDFMFSFRSIQCIDDKLYIFIFQPFTLYEIIYTYVSLYSSPFTFHHRFHNPSNPNSFTPFSSSFSSSSSFSYTRTRVLTHLLLFAPHHHLVNSPQVSFPLTPLPFLSSHTPTHMSTP